MRTLKAVSSIPLVASQQRVTCVKIRSTHTSNQLSDGRANLAMHLSGFMKGWAQITSRV